MSNLGNAMALLSRAPLHPEAFLGPRRVPAGLQDSAVVALDVGAGDRWIEREVSPAATYVALDYPVAPRGLYCASSDLLGNAALLPILDSCVDVVDCLEIVELVKAPECLPTEVARAIRSWGRESISISLLYPVHDAPHAHERWTIHRKERSAASAGLSIVERRSTGTAIETAGLLRCLSPAGLLQKLSSRARAIVTPDTMPLIVVIRLKCCLLARVGPGWSAMATVSFLELRKR